VTFARGEIEAEKRPAAPVVVVVRTAPVTSTMSMACPPAGGEISPDRRTDSPKSIVFGLGLTLVVAPVTATVLAAADARHSGIASGINNAVARVASLLAVAVLPLIGGITGDLFYSPSAMTDGFHIGMAACAVLAALGGIVAWLTISSEVLHTEAEPEGDTPERLASDYSCAVNGPVLRPDREAACHPVSVEATTTAS
jgi:hypothetical protein